MPDLLKSGGTNMEFEKLGSFYLGKRYDIEAQQTTEQLLMYDARDLTTHAVCVGMTGSGKTGLCIGLLEEAALDQIPAIILDPKGDITNLLLQFPDLLPEDFRPWINLDDARRKGLAPDEYAASQAESWRSGLEQWGQNGSRIQKLKQSADFAIYTPGSQAGIPVSILQAFSAPEPAAWESDSELLRERIEGIVGALLGLIGMEADPVQSREHVLLANLFEHFWRQNVDLDLAKLILAVQNPPLRQLGVFDLDAFFPQNDRLELAMKMNSLLASPSFQSWLLGQPLDVPGFLGTPEGKPRHAVFYLAHLNESERIFFVAMLLNEVLTWMRTQPGTTSLRALVYMDEIFGFFPPVAQPASKKPLLTLLKQARAFGVGILLSTQNPMDLDYKGLTNAGTWFIGRLQTDRDKKRMLDGLEGVSSSAGKSLGRAQFSRLISELDKRVFLMHNVHEDEPVLFHTRWVMSFLRGPLTRSQIKELMAGRSAEIPQAASAPGQSEVSQAEGFSSSPPTLPREINQVFLRATKEESVALLDLEGQVGGPLHDVEKSLLYKPMLFATGRVHFVDRRRKVEDRQEYALIQTVPERLHSVQWSEAIELSESDSSRLFSSKPRSGASFAPLPETINEVREMRSLRKELEDHLYRTRSIHLFHSPLLKVYSLPEEGEREFRTRLRQLAREERDDQVEQINRRFESRLRKLQEQIRKAEMVLDKKEATSQARKTEFLVSVGESLVGMFLGRRSMRSASSSLSKYRMKSSAEMAMQEAEERIEALRRDVSALEEELKAETTSVTGRWDEAVEQVETVPVSPRRTDVQVDMIAVAWEPYWLVGYTDTSGLRRIQTVPAFRR